MKKLSILIFFFLSGMWVYSQQIQSIVPAQGYKGQTLTVTISGQSTHFNQGTQTVSFRQGTSTVFYGTNPAGTALSLVSGVSIPLNVPTGYYNVVVENAVDGYLSLASGFQVTPNAPQWPVVTTPSVHTIVVPNYANISVDGTPISNGDYLGVFYEYQGNLICGGSLQWNGSTQTLTAYGDPSGVQGFTSPEVFTWKIWKIASNTEYVGTATYQGSPFPNTNSFVSGGSSGISALAAFTIQSQTINIPQGWSLISSYIQPANPAINLVLAPIISQVVIVKNGIGQLYWPVFNINQIGNMVIGQGYQVNLNQAGSLAISGSAVVPQITPVNLPQGWSFMGYLRQSPGSIVSMLASITPSITIVKDAVGNVYWPVFNVNSIGNMIPGKGYQVRMISPATLYFPANGQSLEKSFSLSGPNHFSNPSPTGNNMTLGIPGSALLELGLIAGDEIAVTNGNGQVHGASVFGGGNLAISIWGRDELDPGTPGLEEGEPFFLVAWKHKSNQEIRIPSLMGEALEFFGKDKIVEIPAFGNADRGFTRFISVFPNPVANIAQVTVDLKESDVVLVEILDGTGKFVTQLAKGKFEAGTVNFSFFPNDLSNGFYFVRVSTSSIVSQERISIVR